MWLLWMSEIIANLIINFSSQCGFGRVHGLSLGFDCISGIIEGKYYGFCGGKQKILLKRVPAAAGLTFFCTLKRVLHKVIVVLESVCGVEFYAHVRSCDMNSAASVGSGFLDNSVKKLFGDSLPAVVRVGIHA